MSRGSGRGRGRGVDMRIQQGKMTSEKLSDVEEESLTLFECQSEERGKRHRGRKTLNLSFEPKRKEKQTRGV